MISVNQALELISEHKLPQSEEEVTLSAALGRRLARPVIAQVSRPPAPVSAMDGYGVRLDDVREPNARLRVSGEAPAGTPFMGTVRSGEAVRVFTGSEIPVGADHVVIQEDAQRQGDHIMCAAGYKTAQYVRREGLDFAHGDTLVEAGTALDPSHLAIIAAGNNGSVSVYRRPRVGLLANGDELKPPGASLSRGQIVNSNPAALAPLIHSWGAEPIDLGVAGDSVLSIREHMHGHGEIDLYVPIGGASVGDHDHMRTAFTEEGFAPVFQKIAVKPGKPTWFSTKGDQRVLGLPGNPASALVCAHLFVATLLGQNWQHRQVNAKLGAALTANGKREQFLRAAAQIDPSGSISVIAAPNQDSSLLRPFLSCNALIRREIGAPGLETGQTVSIIPIGPLQGA